jgi:acetolactate synthase-1/2/3 large subunit
VDMTMNNVPETLTGGEALVRRLLHHNLNTVFALPGIQNDHLFNAFYDHRHELRIVHTRHEQGAAYMALGAALATGQPSVCNVVPGPGVLNASAALATAQALNAPVLFICGQLALGQIGRRLGVLHETTGQFDLLRNLTKLALHITHPSEIPTALDKAVHALTTGRSSPVAVEVPMDVLAQSAPVAEPPAAPPMPAGPPLDGALLDRIAESLAAAQTPLIFVGSGALGVSDAVRALSEHLQAPVVSYRTGRGIVDSRSDLSFVLPAARTLWRESDAVLALGTTLRIPLQNWGRIPDQKLLRIDVDPTTHELIRKPDVALTARLEDALPALLDRLQARGRAPGGPRERLLAVRHDWERRASVLEPQISYLKVIRECLGETGILVDELTQMGFASRLVYPVYRPRTFLSTGYIGTLGYGFPTALGAKLARPECPVISITGDGGFLFCATELATAVQHRIPLTTIVFNDNRFGNVQQMQRNVYGGRVIATDLVNPDFVHFAESFGVRSHRVHSPSELAPVLERSLAADGPVLIEVPVGDMPSVDQFR